MTSNNNFPFPAEEKLKAVCQKISDPNYDKVNYVLPKNANSTAKAKYELCQDISRYQRENNLSDQELAQKLGINVERTENLLFSKSYLFNLEELITYTDSLHIPFEIKITNAKIERIKDHSRA